MEVDRKHDDIPNTEEDGTDDDELNEDIKDGANHEGCCETRNNYEQCLYSLLDVVDFESTINPPPHPPTKKNEMNVVNKFIN